LYKVTTVPLSVTACYLWNR